MQSSINNCINMCHPQNGSLRVGDHLLYVNQYNVRGMGADQVASVLRQHATARLRLVVARPVSQPAASVSGVLTRSLFYCIYKCTLAFINVLLYF